MLKEIYFVQVGSPGTEERESEGEVGSSFFFLFQLKETGRHVTTTTLLYTTERPTNFNVTHEALIYFYTKRERENSFLSVFHFSIHQQCIVSK